MLKRIVAVAIKWLFGQAKGQLNALKKVTKKAFWVGVVVGALAGSGLGIILGWVLWG